MPRDPFIDWGALIHVRTSPRRHIIDDVGAPLTFAPHTTRASVGVAGLVDAAAGPGTV